MVLINKKIRFSFLFSKKKKIYEKNVILIINFYRKGFFNIKK